MTCPRVEIDLDKVRHNAAVLVDRLGARGIAVTGVTKAVLGHAEVARAMLDGGVRTLGDSRVENLAALRGAPITAPMTLIRSPMLSQADRVVVHAGRSHNSELAVVAALSEAARSRDILHGIVLMVELGDLREGVMPEDVAPFVEAMRKLPNLLLAGLGTNLACRSGVIPDEANMAALSDVANSVEERFGLPVSLVSGGNSATIDWALTADDVGRVNDLRLGEAILLGREPLHRTPIEGLHTDAFTVVAEVIESKTKPSRPWGAFAEAAFGAVGPADDRGAIVQTLLAVGEQDVDATGLTPGEGVTILGASSDHLVVQTAGVRAAGTTMRFEPTYSALLRAMTSPFVAVVTAAATIATPTPPSTTPGDWSVTSTTG